MWSNGHIGVLLQTTTKNLKNLPSKLRKGKNVKRTWRKRKKKR